MLIIVVVTCSGNWMELFAGQENFSKNEALEAHKIHKHHKETGIKIPIFTRLGASQKGTNPEFNRDFQAFHVSSILETILYRF